MHGPYNIKLSTHIFTAVSAKLAAGNRDYIGLKATQKITNVMKL
jgi:hypothetical protein